MATSSTTPRNAPLPVRQSLRDAYRLTFTGLGTSLLVVLVVQGAIAIVAAPFLVGVFDLTLRSAGLSAVTDRTIVTLFAHPLAVVWLILAAVLTVIALLAQSAVFACVAGDRMLGARASAHSVTTRLLAVLRRLLRRPSTLLLVPYLVVIVPLGNVTTGSLLTRWVAVPQFVVDELLKEPSTAALYFGVMAIVWYLNIRLLFAIPVLVLTDATVPSAFAQSWTFTRWRSVKVVMVLAGTVVPLLAVLIALGFGALLPTMLADALAPAAAAFVAAVSIGISGVVVFALVGLMLLTQVQSLVAALVHAGAVAGASDQVTMPESAPGMSHRRRLVAGLAAFGTVTAAGLLTAQAYPAMAHTADAGTVVLAHRGWVAQGVENTLPSLDGAQRIGSDVVEMDIQQTADHGWVLMHDFDLRRLAGMNTSVAKLTEAEATTVELHEDGHEATLPTLAAYLERAAALEQLLLIEIKVHGGESADYIHELLALLDEHGGANQHIYHSLDPHAVAALKHERPELMVGFIVPLSFGGVPETPADFLVLEQSAYSDARRESIHDSGRQVFVWTVQEPEQMRMLYRGGVDGIITDHPDVALAQRDAVADEEGMTQRLWDALQRLITVG